MVTIATFLTEFSERVTDNRVSVKKDWTVATDFVEASSERSSVRGCHHPPILFPFCIDELFNQNAVDSNILELGNSTFNRRDDLWSGIFY